MIGESSIVAAWQERCLLHLRDSDTADLALMIVINDQHLRIKGYSFRHILFRFFQSRVNARSQQPVNIAYLLDGIPTLHPVVHNDGASRRLSEADSRQIASYDLDFILLFCQDDVVHSKLIARHGIWCFRHAEIERYTSEVPCFWEIYNGDPITGAVLKRLVDDKDSAVILKRGFFATVRTSYAADLDAIFFSSAEWPALVCRDIKNGIASYLEGQPLIRTPRQFGIPTNLQMVKFALISVYHRTVATYQRWFRRFYWNIGIVREPVYSFLEPHSSPDVCWLQPHIDDKFIADPCGFEKNGKRYVFCEQFDYRSYKGGISFFEVGDRLQALPPEPAIEEPFHTSFPQVFEHDDSIYCVPESFEARAVNLYAATDFPSRWTKVGTLIKDFAAIDSTLFRYDGRWWLFCTDYDRGHSVALCLWYAPSPVGPWQPHAANPVKMDVRSARPAGSLFTHHGDIYRPAQDCSEDYGRRIVINRILRLSTTEFEEEQAATIEPFKSGLYRDGIHTVSPLGDFTLVDGKRYVFDSALLYYKFRFALQKMLEGLGISHDFIESLKSFLRRYVLRTRE